MGIHVDQYRDFIEAARKRGATVEDIPRLRREFLKSIGQTVQEVLPAVETEEPSQAAEPVKRPEIYRGPTNSGRTKKYWYDRF